MSLGSVVIFVEFSVLYWYFDLVLNASMTTTRVAMRVYMFHDCQFHATVMSLFFHSHEPYDDITLDDVCPLFHPPTYPNNEESDSDTWLTPTYSVESDLSESLYHSVIYLTSNSSSSAASQAPPQAVVKDSFVPEVCLMGEAELEEEDVEMTHLVVLETDSFRSEDEDGLDSTYWAWIRG